MPENCASSPSSVSVGDYEVAPMRMEHARAIALAHMACFPGYFLTSLGLPYVELFYRALAMNRLGLGVVAVDQSGKVLCFAAGATKSDDFMRYFHKHFFFHTAWALLAGFCRDKQVRYYVLHQSYRITNALKLLTKRPGVGNLSAAPANGKGAGTHVNAYSLMSMGNLPECRGSRVASEIIRAFESAVLARGVSAVKVSTGKDNQRAIGFYQKNGYEVYRDTRPGDVDLIKLLKI